MCSLYNVGKIQNEHTVILLSVKLVSTHMIVLYIAMHLIIDVHVCVCRNEGGRPNRRLFCYVDSDHFQVPVEEV